ncbi:MAG: hypothetical protein H6Q73_3767 [Firmicutes bacterium]|nr:hypothetical protein [Bacillota bacterium]
MALLCGADNRGPVAWSEAALLRGCGSTRALGLRGDKVSSPGQGGCRHSHPAQCGLGWPSMANRAELLPASSLSATAAYR